MGRAFAGSWSPLLGTVVEVRGTAADPDAVEAAVLAELMRLQAVFSVFDPGSDLARWRGGADAAASPDLVAVLARAEELHRCSGGAFHPAAGVLRRRWLAAESEGVVPARAELAGLAASCPLPFRVREGRVERTGDCSGVDLNALAKGYAVDRALAAGWAAAGGGAEAGANGASLVVNAGGDLAHRGSGGVLVGVEDPLRAVDNAPPVARVRGAGAALATSGGARRGFRVAGRWFGHVLDPRSGWPVEGVASASVLAADACAADGLATVLLVGGPEPAVACAVASGPDWLLVDDRGRVSAAPGSAFEVG